MCPSSTSSSEPAPEAATRSAAGDGLIEAPETFGGGRGLLLAVIAVFLGAIVGTGLIDTLHPRPLPQLIGDEKERDDQVRAEAELLDGSLARLIENDLRLKSRVRRKVTEPYAMFMYTWLREAKDVIVGDDGWLFLESRARPPAIRPAVIAARSAHQLAALDRLLHARGSKLVAAPVPRKAVVLEELLPRGIVPVREIEEQLVLQLRALGVCTADLLGAFAGRDPRELFHPGDSHWTTDAEILAAEEISSVGGFRIPPEERETELRVLEGVALGLDLIRWIGAGLDGNSPSLQHFRRDKYDVHRKSDGSKVRRSNPEKVGRIALAGTSFSARRSLPVLLSHCSGETVWNAAKPGEGPMSPLRDFLASLGDDPWPEIIVLEFPVHLTLSTRGLRTVAPIFTDWTPPRLTPVVGHDAWRTWKPKKTAGRRWARIAALPAGALGHSGDGCVSVRLQGQAADRVELMVDVAGSKLEYTWTAGRDELVLPLMAEAATSGTVTVSQRSKKAGSLTLERIEIVSPLAEAPLASAEVLRPARDRGKSWVQEARFEPATELVEQAVLRASLGDKRVQGRLRLEVLLEGESEPARSFSFRVLSAGARIALGLDGLAGRRIASVRLVGEGKPPETGLLSAGIHAP